LENHYKIKSTFLPNETGERKWVLCLDINDLPKYKSWWVFRDGDIKAFLLSSRKEDGTRQWIVPVTKDKVSAQDNIIIAGITSDSELLRKTASLASMENPGAAYLYENDTSEDAQNKIRIQLSQNAGPDIMLVSRQDFYDLNEKGLFMYAEGKDAKTTAEIINNRVQTYLNEQ